MIDLAAETAADSLCDDLFLLNQLDRSAAREQIASRIAGTNAETYRPALDALRACLQWIVETINSGDCGFWDPETEPVVQQTRAVLMSFNKKEQTDGEQPTTRSN